MGEDEVKGTIQYYDMNLGEWRELAKTTEVPELVMTTEQVEDAKRCDKNKKKGEK